MTSFLPVRPLNRDPLEVTVGKMSARTIERVTAWMLHLPYAEGPYRMSGDRITTGMDALVVRLVADDGTVGLGESGTIGVTYDAAFPGGQRAALDLLGPAIVDSDPRSPQSVARAMHHALSGHPYAKAGIDMACWDLAARLAGVPLWQLLGGDGPGATPLYRPVQGATPQEAAAKAVERIAQGNPRLQVKVGDDPLIDAARVLAVRDAVGPDVPIYADANCGFLLGAARAFIRELGSGGAGVHLEQPCATLDDCIALRTIWGGPMVLDESMVSLAALLAAHRAGAVDGITIKLTRVGGITPAKLMRDVAVELGVAVTIEDAGGGDLITMAFAHMNGSTPARNRAHTCDFGEWVISSHVSGPTSRHGGSLVPQSEEPGLGMTLVEDQLGEPIYDLTI
jgi:L-alanine-DL-glutamate epimerase-like enolase superfamily enzyme